MTPRARLVAALCTAPLLALAPAAPGTAAPFPDEVALPDASSPEGITDGPGTTFFAGSRNTGSIVVGDARTGRTTYLVDPVAPAPGVTRVVGLDFDQAERTVVTAGGTTGRVDGYDSRTGEPVFSAAVPGRPGSERFLNDVVAANGVAYVTDSRTAELVVVEDGVARLLPLTGDFQQPADPRAFGLNGIVLLPGGDLLVVGGGELYRVDPGTGVTTVLAQTAGLELTGGDGLELRGSTLYVTHGFGRDSIAVVDLDLARDAYAVVGTLAEPALDRPTTSALVAGALYAVNGRFTTPGATEFSVVRVELR